MGREFQKLLSFEEAGCTRSEQNTNTIRSLSMARRRDLGKAEILNEEDLKELRHNLARKLTRKSTASAAVEVPTSAMGQPEKFHCTASIRTS
jgi:hypothetical protein